MIQHANSENYQTHSRNKYLVVQPNSGPKSSISVKKTVEMFLFGVWVVVVVEWREGELRSTRAPVYLSVRLSSCLYLLGGPWRFLFLFSQEFFTCATHQLVLFAPSALCVQRPSLRPIE